jgi:tetratricopeptide (TPR) repeat protein
MPAVIEGLLLYRQGQYGAAVPHFEEALKALSGRTVQMPEVNYYIADSYARLERYAEAERYFGAELSLFPNNLRARAGRAMLYRATGRDADSEKAIEDLLRIAPTREGYDLAAQLWGMFGEPRKAAAAKAEAGRRPG